MNVLRSIGSGLLWLCIAITMLNMLWVTSFLWLVARALGLIDKHGPSWREMMRWVLSGDYLDERR